MTIGKIKNSITQTPKGQEYVQNNIVDLAVRFLKSEHIQASLNSCHKEVIEKLLNHFTFKTELILTQYNLEVLENMEHILKPILSSEESMIVLYLYITARCSLENASDKVIKSWQGLLAVFNKELGD